MNCTGFIMSLLTFHVLRRIEGRKNDRLLMVDLKILHDVSNIVLGHSAHVIGRNRYLSLLNRSQVQRSSVKWLCTGTSVAESSSASSFASAAVAAACETKTAATASVLSPRIAVYDNSLIATKHPAQRLDLLNARLQKNRLVTCRAMSSRTSAKKIIPDDTIGYLKYETRPRVDNRFDRLHLAARVEETLKKDLVRHAYFMVINSIGVGDTVPAWNELIRYYLKRNSWQIAFKFLNDMKKRGVNPSVTTYHSLFKAMIYERFRAASRPMPELRWSWLLSLAEAPPEHFTWNPRLVACAMKAIVSYNDPTRVFDFYAHVADRCKPTAVTYGILIDSLALDGTNKSIRDGIKLWEEYIARCRAGEMGLTPKAIRSWGHLALKSKDKRQMWMFCDVARDIFGFDRKPCPDEVLEIQKKYQPDYTLYSMIEPGPSIMKYLVACSVKNNDESIIESAANIAKNGTLIDIDKESLCQLILLGGKMLNSSMILDALKELMYRDFITYELVKVSCKACTNDLVSLAQLVDILRIDERLDFYRKVLLSKYILQHVKVADNVPGGREFKTAIGLFMEMASEVIGYVKKRRSYGIIERQKYRSLVIYQLRKTDQLWKLPDSGDPEFYNDPIFREQETKLDLSLFDKKSLLTHNQKLMARKNIANMSPRKLRSTEETLEKAELLYWKMLGVQDIVIPAFLYHSHKYRNMNKPALYTHLKGFHGPKREPNHPFAVTVRDRWTLKVKQDSRRIPYVGMRRPREKNEDFDEWDEPINQISKKDEKRGLINREPEGTRITRKEVTEITSAIVLNKLLQDEKDLPDFELEGPQDPGAEYYSIEQYKESNNESNENMASSSGQNELVKSVPTIAQSEA